MDKVAEIYRNRLQAFTKNHLLGGLVYSSKHADLRLSAWAAPDRVPFRVATDESANRYEEIKVGHKFGPAWSTHWVKVQVSDVGDVGDVSATARRRLVGLD